jgi:bifunctional non-homologous end joining protein LigD
VQTTIPFRVSPMLATLVREPFHRHDWVFEEKYDGVRLLAYKEGNRVKLITRNNIDRSARFPHIAEAIRKLRHVTLLLDGEVVVFDRKHVSRFQLLQNNTETSVYAAFDCLYVEGNDLRQEPLSKRRAAMEDAIGSNRLILPSRSLAPNGLTAYRIAQRKGIEGVLAKDLSSTYLSGRSKSWLKIKVHQQDEFVIVGFTQPTGSRKHLGALLLGAYRGKQLYFTGKVGTGFNEQSLAMLAQKLRPLILKGGAAARGGLANPPRGAGVTYVQPRLVAQISYHEWTADQKLRQPVFLGLRDDKNPKDVELPEH